MKKTLQFALTLMMCTMLFLCLVPGASAASGKWGSLSWSLDSSGVLTISGSGRMNDFTAESKDAWRAYKTDIKSVVINNGVTSIGDYAFGTCFYLNNVSFPSDIKSIGTASFYGSYNLEGISIIPKSVTSIGIGAFSSTYISIIVDSQNAYYCDLDGVLFNKNKTRLCCYPGGKGQTYTIPSGVTTIEPFAFSGNNDLSELVISSDVTSISDYAFDGCESLKIVTIPSSVETIGSYAFKDCTNFTDVYYKGSSSQWGSIKIGIGNDYLNNATLHTSTNTWGDLNWSIDSSGVLTIYGSGEMKHFTGTSEQAWRAYKKEIKSVVISNGVTSIGSYAFYDCDGLTGVMIPSSVTNIGDKAFWGCKKLTDVSIPDNVIQLGTSIFAFCNSLKNMKIPNGVTSIPNEAFENCTSLTSVTIPNSVTGIGSKAFYNCIVLRQISIPNSVTNIGNEAFSGCYALLNITIPNSVTSIGYRTFNSCFSLTNVTISDGVTKIDSDAFRDCSNMTSVTIPSSVIRIMNYAFDGCSSLMDVYYGGNADNWEEMYIASHNTTLISATRHYIYEWLQPDFILPASLTIIDSEAFAGGAFRYAKLPEQAIIIEENAFADCSNLMYIYIPATVTQIDQDAFGSRTKLTIFGKTGSAAQSYALNHGFTFIPE